MKTEELVEFIEEIGFEIEHIGISLILSDSSGYSYVLEGWSSLSKKDIIQFIWSESYSAGWSEELRSLCEGYC